MTFQNYVTWITGIFLFFYIGVWIYSFYHYFGHGFKIKSGGRRFVFLIGKKAYKIPKFTAWVSFIRGIEENLEERYWYSADGSRKRKPNEGWNQEIPLAEIYWADRFGFLVVMERLDTVFHEYYNTSPHVQARVQDDIEKLIPQVKGFRFADDLKIENLGYRGNRLIFLDYGFYGGTMDCYIGT